MVACSRLEAGAKTKAALAACPYPPWPPIEFAVG